MASGGQPVHPAVVVPDNLTALGIIRSLTPSGVACTVGVSDALGPAQYSRHVRTAPCPPPTAGRAFVEGLIVIGRSFAIPPVLFVTDESSMLMVDRFREVLASHFRLTLPSSEQLACWVSKPRLYEFSKAAGVSTPDTQVLAGDELPRGIEFPLVLKPAQRVIFTGEYTLRSFRREFGCKAMRVSDPISAQTIARRAHARGFQMLLQRSVPGDVSDLLTAGVFRGTDGRRALFTARKLAQVPSEFGDGSVVEGLPIPELAAPTWQLVERAGLVGIADIEFKRDADDGQLKLLDLNPRPWLWIELATRCGVNLPSLAYGEAIGQPVTVAPVQRATRVKWCSARTFIRTLSQGDAPGRLAAWSSALEAWRHSGDDLTSRGDGLLWRRALRPSFWREALRAARERLPEP
ncbi:MAG TPA: ATP-grasp domain-containing protein [Candidatus Binatia bacterium]|nr:ATP-grasp domain-containing protein [Candidatus Binatia bacterium]